MNTVSSIPCSSPVIGVLDTAVASSNLGDCIIMDSARIIIDIDAGACQQLSFPTHIGLGLSALRMQRAARLHIACGTNLLHAHMGIVRQWRVGPIDALMMRRVVLFGVGWRSQEKRRTDRYTRWLLGRLLSKDHLHSARDSYSAGRLAELGFENVINTGCPTLWGLTPAHCAQIPRDKAVDAVVVLTDYSRDEALDQRLLDAALGSYRKVYFWPQGVGDLAYLETLSGNGRVERLARNLRAYDSLLADPTSSLDYVGTRLHGGIRALQHGRRSIIIGVDHRANAMGRDFNLPVLDRHRDSSQLQERIQASWPTEVALPIDQIMRWRKQLRELASIGQPD